MNDHVEPTSPYLRGWNSTGNNNVQVSFSMTSAEANNNDGGGEEGGGHFAANKTIVTQSSTRSLHRAISNISMPNEKSYVFGSISNLVNSIVGAGIIGIPYAISNSGFVVGIFLLVLVSFMTDKTLRMMVEMATYHPKLRYYGVRTYEDLARIPFGRLGSGLVLGGMLVLAYGAMLAYLLIIKDTVPSILGLTSEAGKGTFMEAELPMMVASVVIILPLSMMRDMASLEKTSLLSVLADVTLVGIMIFKSPISSTVEKSGGFWEVIKQNAVNSKVFIGLGVLSTAMACQHCAFIVSNSLQDLTPNRWSTVTGRSIAISCCCCMFLGVVGYLGFLEETQGNILNNFDADSMVANTGRGLLATTMFFTYPMEAFVARHVLVEMFFDGDVDGKRDTTFSKYCGRRQRITFFIYVSTLVPALVVDDLGPVLSLTGALGASFLSYIGTGAVYLGLNGDDFMMYCLTLLTKGLQQVPTMEEPKKRGKDIATNEKDQNQNYDQNDQNQNDEDILSQCQKMLSEHQDHVDPRQQTNLLQPSEVELANMGNSTTAPTSSDEPTNGRCASSNIDNAKSSEQQLTSIPTEELLSRIRKPFWWYLFLFPIWTAIAAKGAKGTRDFFDDYIASSTILVDEGTDSRDNGAAAAARQSSTAGASNHENPAFASIESVADSPLDNDIVIGPCEQDYHVSMFLITFGFFAAVIGVASNVIVEVDKLVYAPPG
ncbi:hypothetical protein ACA910_010002 [Epithemia clementina (nom. ined.)]